MKVAVLGTGLMGRAIAERFLACRRPVVVYNRTTAKTAPLAALGAEVADTPDDAIRHASYVLLLLSDAEAIRSLLPLHDRPETIRHRVLIQMGTIGSSESRDLERAVVNSGGEYLEAPVLGSLAEAKAGELLVMVGGTRDQFDRCRDVLSVLGKRPQLIGPVGHAASLKLALNQLIASHIAAFSLSLGYLDRAGVSIDAFRTILGESALTAPMFEKKYPRLAARRYDTPNFSVRHLLKDVRLFLREAQVAGLDTRSLDNVPTLLDAAIDLHRGDEDYSAVYEAINPAPKGPSG
ncbi:3-hydroxy acid dehydrogenase [Nitrospira sp.]|nr:3-hydroxy acid dehydrogenase [Nitrospira sp.]